MVSVQWKHIFRGWAGVCWQTVHVQVQSKFNPYEKTFGTGNFGFCGRVWSVWLHMFFKQAFVACRCTRTILKPKGHLNLFLLARFNLATFINNDCRREQEPVSNRYLGSRYPGHCLQRLRLETSPIMTKMQGNLYFLPRLHSLIYV